MRGIGFSLALVAIFVIAAWLIATMTGWHMSLTGSLAISVGLTLGLNLIVRRLRRSD